MMRNKISILLMSLVVIFMAACNDDDNSFSGPYTIVVAGPGSVVPGDVETYQLTNYQNASASTWTVEGPATIVGGASGESISVEFTGVGDVTITVKNGTDTGIVEVSVSDVEPAVSVGLNGTGMLRNGVSDTVFFSFDAPLAADPTLAVNTDSSAFNDGSLAFTSGTLGNLVKVDDQNYYAIYTAGAGNGTPEALLTGMKSTSKFGDVALDSAYVQLYTVDNIAPVADLSYSKTMVNDSTVITVTATFSEPVMFESAADSALLIMFSGAGVQAETDTLEATSDPLVYTYKYTVNGGGDGTLDVALDNIVDLAGNSVASVDNTSAVTVDNTNPVIGLATASDDGDYVTLSMAVSEGGTGWYLVLPDGADAPETAHDFSGGVASGSWDTSGLMVSATLSLAPGDYDVYFIAGDAAGNYSDISMVDLTVIE